MTASGVDGAFEQVRGILDGDLGRLPWDHLRIADAPLASGTVGVQRAAANEEDTMSMPNGQEWGGGRSAASKVAWALGVVLVLVIIGFGLVLASTLSSERSDLSSERAAAMSLAPTSSTTTTTTTTTTTAVPPTIIVVTPPPGPVHTTSPEPESYPAPTYQSGYSSSDECGDDFMRNWVERNRPSATEGYVLDIGTTEANESSDSARIVICQLRNESGPVGGLGYYFFATILSSGKSIVIPADNVDGAWFATDGGVTRIVTVYGLEVRGGPNYTQAWRGVLEGRADRTAFDYG